MRRFLRRLAHRVQWHSESGHMLAGVIIGAGAFVVYFGLPMLVGAATDFSDWAHGRWNPQPQVGSSKAQFPFIGPAMVDITHGDQTKTDCVLQAASAAGLQYSNQSGWSAPSVYDQPPPTARQGAVDAWVSQVQSYYQSRQGEWASCLTTLPPPAPPPAQEATIPYAGTYSLSYPDIAASADGGACPPFGGPPGTLDVLENGSAENATIGLPSRHTSASYYDTLTGGVTRSYTFTMNGNRDAGSTGPDSPSLTIRMSGTFDTDGTNDNGAPKVVIRNGQLSYGGSVQCSWSFTGTKTSN